jgi:mono/diheme cytochrome c family protein
MYLKSGLLFAGCIIVLSTMASCASNNEEELYPIDTCDTVQVTYSLTIAPIIAQNCAACHSGLAPISNIPLDTYSGVKAMVDAERLVGSLRRLDGFSPMPQNAPSLPECELLQIETWVNAEAPDN